MLKEFVEPTVADWKHREEKMVDGYPWIYENISEIDLTFIPFMSYQIWVW